MYIKKTLKSGIAGTLILLLLLSVISCGRPIYTSVSDLPNIQLNPAPGVSNAYTYKKNSIIQTQFLVKFKEGVPESVINSFLKKYDVRVLRTSSSLNVRLVQSYDPAFIERTQAENINILEYVENNCRYSVNFTVNDPRSSDQKGIATVNIAKAWDITLGDANIIIGIVDTGADLTHPDLVSKLVPGFNVITNGQTPPKDDNGHGTHVAGITAAATDNKVGIAGVAPRCMVMPVKALDNAGNGDVLNLSVGIVWAVDHGAKVINLSLGGDNAPETLKRAVQYALSHRVPIISATGNGNEEGIGVNEPRYPAALPGVIAVGALDSTGRVASFSNYGKWTTVVVPGERILSTTPTYDLPGMIKNYDFMDGTSMASPIVAGVVALMLSRNPNMTPAMVKTKLESTAKAIGSSGFNEKAGYGLVDAEKAVQ